MTASFVIRLRPDVRDGRDRRTVSDPKVPELFCLPGQFTWLSSTIDALPSEYSCVGKILWIRFKIPQRAVAAGPRESATCRPLSMTAFAEIPNFTAESADMDHKRTSREFRVPASVFWRERDVSTARAMARAMELRPGTCSPASP